MLKSLYIRNLALVSELHLEPAPDFNAVTGETGAGKSLIIGALKLLAGARTSPSVIRKGEKLCEVAGEFSIQNATLRTDIDAMLSDAGVPPCEDGQLMIKRVVSENGSRAFVNASSVPLGWLKNLGDKLIDIHGPHDNQSLLSNSVQLSLLDDYAGLRDLRGKCASSFQEMRQAEHDLEALESQRLSPEDAMLLRHQLKEIKAAGLSADEEGPLMEQYRLASHARTLCELAARCADGLDRNEQSITSMLGDFVRIAREISDIDSENGTRFIEQLDAVYEEIRGLADDFENYASHLDMNEEQMQILEERVELLQKLKRKYGHSISEVLATMERMELRLAATDSLEERAAELKRRMEELHSRHLEQCRELRTKRREAAGKLCMEILEKLRHLGFGKAQFDLEFSEAEPGVSGMDAVEFMFSANVGEDRQPLRKIASSGEIARVMLAVKTVLSAVDNIPVLVFDEIDANIGGQVSATVAGELRTVAAMHQVFSITHLPVIAAAGNMHFLVRKHVEGERTFAEIVPLEDEARVRELSRMLGDDGSSEAVRQHALELLGAYTESGKTTAREKTGRHSGKH